MPAMAKPGQRELDKAFDGLERQAPDRVSRAIRWLRGPRSRRFRIPLGILLILGSTLWFLPVFGLEMLPLGLLLIAQDIPPLRKPAARMMIKLEQLWCRLRGRHDNCP